MVVVVVVLGTASPPPKWVTSDGGGCRPVGWQVSHEQVKHEMETRVVPTIVRLVRGLLTRIDDANGRDINITVDTDEVYSTKSLLIQKYTEPSQSSSREYRAPSHLRWGRGWCRPSCG
jgi:hypothetical protein